MRASNDPGRWQDRRSWANRLEDRAATLASAVADVPPLGADALTRIRAGALTRGSIRGARALHRLPLPLRFSLAGGLTLLLVGTAGGATALWRRYVAATASTVKPAVVAALSAPSKPRGPRTRARPPTAPSEPVTEPPDEAMPPPPDVAAPTPAPVPAPARAAAPILVPARRRPESRAALPSPRRSVALLAARPAAPEARSADDGGPVQEIEREIEREAPAPTAPGAEPAGPWRSASPPIASNRPRPDLPETERDGRIGVEKETEAHLLARAISQLRRARDPRAALATLDRYAQLFPHGVLTSESARTRLEAVLQLNDLGRALSMLDGKTGFVGPLDADLLLTRAELRASAGRCPDAVADFTRALAQQGSQRTDGSRERALYGRAVCLGRLRQDDRARADLVNYLGHFPAGRFAFEARRLLEGRDVPGHP